MHARSTTAGIALSGAALLMTACGSRTPTSTVAAPATSTATGAAPAPTGTPATSTPSTSTARDPGSTASPAPPAPASTPTGGRACVTSDLEFSLEPSKGMGDVRSADVVVTNVHANGPCGVFGYGGLGLLDARGGALPTNLTRLRVPAQGLEPRQITLAPGASALEHLEWTDTTTTRGSSAGCVMFTDVIVTPPDDEPSAVVPFAATVCDSGTITGWPYVAR